MSEPGDQLSRAAERMSCIAAKLYYIAVQYFGWPHHLLPTAPQKKNNKETTAELNRVLARYLAYKNERKKSVLPAV